MVAKKTKLPKPKKKTFSSQPPNGYKLTPPKFTKAAGRRKEYTLPVMVYLTPGQKESLSRRAVAKGLPLSTFIREQALADGK